MEKFNLDLSLVARLGGHSQPRTHRGKERFPGMTITYALIQMLEKARVKRGKQVVAVVVQGTLVDVAKHRVCCGGNIASLEDLWSFLDPNKELQAMELGCNQNGLKSSSFVDIFQKRFGV